MDNKSHFCGKPIGWVLMLNTAPGNPESYYNKYAMKQYMKNCSCLEFLLMGRTSGNSGSF